MEFNYPYIVYVKPNSDGYITAVNSSAFLIDTTGWVEIDSGFGDKYHHAQRNYFPKPILTEDGAYCYAYDSGIIRALREEELSTQILPIERTPTLLDRIEAQITYTAMMTDTLLEE